ncbi:MAG: regulatory protein RecX [Patescibacteria group bacterium]
MDLSESTVYERLMNAAIRYISFRLRSEKEIRDFIRQKLIKSHTTAPEVEARVLHRLGELDYVNDEKFCEWWLSQRQGSKPKGIRLIRAELAQKGIARALIDKAVSQSASDERTLAYRAINKKREIWRQLPLLARKKKLGDYLLRRGFSSDVVRGVVDDVVENV